MYPMRTLLRRALPSRLALSLRKHYMVHRMLHATGTEEEDIRNLHNFIKPGDTVFDIGANNGAFTVEMSRLVGSAGRVYAFEPVPHNLDILKTVVRKLKLLNVTIFPVAVCDILGRRGMEVPDLGFGGGYYLAQLSSGAGNFEVDCDTLDSLIEQGAVDVPSFIKCDVEGFEQQVIAGARRLITEHHPGWLLETFKDEVFPIMHALNYRSFVYEVHNQLEPVDGRLAHARNYYFLP